MDIEFRDVSYSVKQLFSKERKTLLNSISGNFKQGQLCGIIGPSGAGKSTLLQVLAQRVAYEGSVMVSGKNINEGPFRKSFIYIEQEDHLHPGLTVFEAMTISARLRLPSNTTKQSRNLKIDEILTKLGLRKCRESLVTKISGGERKRLSIALELVANPLLFIMDEPTTGLDMRSTKQCAEVLQMLAKLGKTVICTVHQPTASVLSMFDSLYVIAYGTCVYNGSVDGIVPFMSTVGLECPSTYNPAEYVIEVTDSRDREDTFLRLSSATQNGKLRFENRPKNGQSFWVAESSFCPQNALEGTITTSDSELCKLGKTSSSWRQFCTLMWQARRQNRRDPLPNILLVVHTIFCSLGMGTLYYNRLSAASNALTHIYFCLCVAVFFMFTQIVVSCLRYSLEVDIVRKEISNRWYRLGPYFAATNLKNLPLQIPINCLYCFVVCIMSGIPMEPLRYGLFALVCNTLALTTESLGLVIGSKFETKGILIIACLIMCPSSLIGIYGIDFAKQLSNVTKILLRFSFPRSAFHSLFIVIFGLNRKDLVCEEDFCMLKNTSVLLEMLDLENANLFIEMIPMFVWMILCRVVAYCLLRSKYKHS